MKNISLVVNESYWNFPKERGLKTLAYLKPKIDDLISGKNTISEFTRNLGILMKMKDSDDQALYGIEIKTNGSSRSSRIPLVRYSPVNQSIWKIVRSLKEMEKGIVELNDLIYFLKGTRNDSEPLPIKVLLIISPESDYTEKGEYVEFVKSKVDENGVILISFEFLKDILQASSAFDFNSLLTPGKSIITKNPLPL